MAFPIGPTNGQITTVNGLKYIYSSATNSWARLGSAKFTAAASAPSNAAQGDRWYNTGLDILFEFINDGTSNYWVDIQSVGQTGNVTSISDSVLNGNIVVGVNNRYSIGTSVGYLQNIYANNITANSTVSNTIVTGSGGLAVDGVGIFGGNLVAAATTSTSSVTTGALVVRGGVGIAGNIYVGGVSNLAGNVTVTGNILPGANDTYSIGTPGNTFTTVYAKATSAQYADLAEIYVPDRHYEPGTVVVFGGDREITETTADHDPRVAGVISTNPAYLMNSESTGVPVALTGRVPCHVQGPVDKGDLLVTSNISGVAQRLVADKFRPGCIIGKSLECIMHDEIKLVEIVVGRF